MPEATGQKGKGGCQAILVVIAVIFVIGLIGKCTPPKDPKAQAFASPSLLNQIEEIPAAPTVDSLATASVDRGGRHLLLVFDAEGPSGAMIYSQNCFDSLSHDFSWTKLDTCGGFDQLAVAAVADADATAFPNEVAFFNSEAAAMRYLTAATKAGEKAEDADKRLEALQRRSMALKKPKKATSATPASSGTDEDSGDDGPGESGDTWSGQGVNGTG